MILSRNRLLFLDPHYAWSNGGPVYDFVAESTDGAIKNHMKTFSSVISCLDQELEGTVIRIPLRNKEQARTSEISERETTVEDIQQVLKIFASEFGHNGLLFMRNVESLKILSSGMSVEIEMADRSSLRM